MPEVTELVGVLRVVLREESVGLCHYNSQLAKEVAYQTLLGLQPQTGARGKKGMVRRQPLAKQ